MKFNFDIDKTISYWLESAEYDLSTATSLFLAKKYPYKRQRIRVAKIILYGSYASGKMHKDSDIDIAVISEDFGKDRFNEGIKLFEIASKIDPRFEPIPISLASYKHDTWLPLIYEIKHKGIECN